MALDLFMLGLLVKDMGRSLEFYRRLGVAIPAEWDGRTHVEVKMGNGLTFFLDSNPARWDPRFPGLDEHQAAGRAAGPESYRSVLEFYLKTREAVDAKYAELIGCGYQSRRAPYESPIGMYFAMVADPDDNTILLSGDVKANNVSKAD